MRQCIIGTAPFQEAVRREGGRFLSFRCGSREKCGMRLEKFPILLYLPWLPLNEGVGFDLEVTPPDGENESNDSKLTVLIQTRNYGNVKGVFTLTTSNSVDIYIICTEDFPKRTLQKSLMEESSSHAMNSTIDIEAVEPKKKEPNDTQEAKVNLSATNEMNPYLLLMAHAFIRNTIFIDSNSITEEEQLNS